MREDTEVGLRHFDHSHGHAIGEQSRKVGNAREGDGTPSGLERTHPSGVIEQPLDPDNITSDGEVDGVTRTYVSVVTQDVETSNLSRGLPQTLQEFGGFGGIGDLSESLGGDSEQESSDHGNRKFHDERGGSEERRRG